MIGYYREHMEIQNPMIKLELFYALYSKSEIMLVYLDKNWWLSSLVNLEPVDGFIRFPKWSHRGIQGNVNGRQYSVHNITGKMEWLIEFGQVLCVCQHCTKIEEGGGEKMENKEEKKWKKAKQERNSRSKRSKTSLKSI